MTTTRDLQVHSLAERPELAGIIWQLGDSWPEFAKHDHSADYYFAQCESQWPEFVLGAVDPDDPATLVAAAYAVPLSVGRDAARGPLPGGWDDTVRQAWLDRLCGREPNVVSALEINVRRSRRGAGLSALMLGELRRRAADFGVDELIAPVRPTGKSAEPHTPMVSYARRVRSDDGLPADPWLRVHVRAGGRIEGVCARSTVVAGSLDQWRSWTGLPFDRSGDQLVEGALVPVHVDVEHDHAVYVEPNVWVRHRCR